MTVIAPEGGGPPTVRDSFAPVTIRDVQSFWDAHPCDSTLSHARERRRFFEEIEQQRYRRQPHIRGVARFSAFAGRRVLELGCGVGTDGLQFARAGAVYFGADLSPSSAGLAQERFLHWSQVARFSVVNGETLPFADESFDHIYSFGVIHHSPDTAAIVAEFRRILRPNGSFCVMVYNRNSVNYHVEIMFLRKLARYLLYPPFAVPLLARVLNVDPTKLERHRHQLLAANLRTPEQWLSANTDGPDCPLARVYGAREVRRLFSAFRDVRTEVRHFDRDHWPFLGRLLPDSVVDWIGRRWGWHRIVYGRK